MKAGGKRLVSVKNAVNIVRKPKISVTVVLKGHYTTYCVFWLAEAFEWSVFYFQ